MSSATRRIPALAIAIAAMLASAVAGEAPAGAASANAKPAPALLLFPPNATVWENGIGGPLTAGMIVVLPTKASKALVLSVASDKPGASVPATVTVPKGATSTTFVVTAVDDGIPAGDRTANVTVSAAGFSSASSVITVKDTTPSVQLKLSFAQQEIPENATTTATVSRPTSVGAVTVGIGFVGPQIVATPAGVTIPDGAFSVDFTVAGIPDGQVTDPRKTAITVSSGAPGYLPDTQSILLDEGDLAIVPTSDNLSVGESTSCMLVARAPQLVDVNGLQVVSQGPVQLFFGADPFTVFQPVWPTSILNGQTTSSPTFWVGNASRLGPGILAVVYNGRTIAHHPINVGFGPPLPTSPQ